MVYKSAKDQEDRKTKLIIEYAKFLASLAKDMEIEFSKDSELFRAFPDAFEEVEGKAGGGAIKVKDAPSFYGLQERIMNFQEGGDVETARQEIERLAGTQSPLRQQQDKEQTMLLMENLGIDPRDPSAVAQLLEAQKAPQEEVVEQETAEAEVIPMPAQRPTSVQDAEMELEARERIDDTPNTAEVPLPTPPRPDREPVEEVATKEEEEVISEVPLPVRKPGREQRERDQFFLDRYNAAVKENHPNPKLYAAQAALESGWGTSSHAKNQFVGMKARKGQKGTTVSTKEEIDGKLVDTEATFADFDSEADSIKQHTTRS